MCEYCNLENYYESYGNDYLLKVLSSSNYSCLSMRYDNTENVFSLVSSGDDETSININFCQMCGRKLCD